MKKKITPIILGLLILIMLVVWSSAFKKPGRAGTSSKNSTSGEGNLNENKKVVFWGARSVKKRMKSGFKNMGRDPFSLAKEATYLADLNLMGILWDKDFPQAIINERIVRVNDVIDGNKVTVINKNSVVLTNGKNRIELKLWSDPEQ